MLCGRCGARDSGTLGAGVPGGGEGGGGGGGALKGGLFCRWCGSLIVPDDLAVPLLAKATHLAVFGLSHHAALLLKAGPRRSEER